MKLPIHPLDFAAILTEAAHILTTTRYQATFIAGKMRPDKSGVMKLQFCDPFDPDAMLSLRGALICACGGGAKSWPIIEFLREFKLLKHDDPLTRAEALHVIQRARKELTQNELSELTATKRLTKVFREVA